jgi:molecular chaperone HtpG
MIADAAKETREFQTEVRQLLNLMIHSLYSNKEIFLRELISNASDANDKLRFEALQDAALNENDSDLNIRINVDKAARTITITDNGIGMTRDEVVQNIGTIASSGTRKFLESLGPDKAKDSQLIGQFGVGFYSAFIVADKVTLVTRRAGQALEHGVCWESRGEGEYTLENIERAARGTEVTLHLRDGEDDFLEGYRLRSLIRKYSDHIAFPILMPKEATEDDKAAEPGDETVNRASALWRRAKQDVSETEYHEFYKNIFYDYEPPLSHSHNFVEGKQSYTTLFYIPKRAPFDLWDRDKRHGVKLYVRRVFIMDDAEHLMPTYLRFVRGIVDSDDLPLNVSRELLQHNKLIDGMRGASVKRVLGMLEDLAANNAEQYQEFWKQFGRVLKEGPAEDFANKERIAKLLRFASTQSNTTDETVSLQDYVGRMKEGQEKIYYITADSFEAAKHSPHLEIFRKKGIEVLLLSDRVDEWLTSHLEEFEGKKLQSVAKGALDLGKLADESDKAEQAAAATTDMVDLIERMKRELGERVKDVRASHRLTESPTCLVVEDHDMALNLQRMLKAAGHAVPTAKPVLEVNPTHPLISHVKQHPNSPDFGDWVGVLFDQALLMEGTQLEDAPGFVRRMNKLLMAQQGIAH